MNDHQHDSSGMWIWGFIVAITLMCLCDKIQNNNERLESLEQINTVEEKDETDL